MQSLVQRKRRNMWGYRIRFRYLVIALSMVCNAWINEKASGYNDPLTELKALTELTFDAPLFEGAEHIASTTASTIESEDGLEFCMTPIWYDALPYKGKPTKVFAWLSLPCESEADENPSKVPAVVLVHGGGGTAWKKWAEGWAFQGFASIAIAVEGQTDISLQDSLVMEGEEQLNLKWFRHEYAGPSSPENAYGDCENDPVQDQWMYHAVADTLLANALLHSFDYIIDTSSIGLHGVSWGSVVSLTALPFVNPAQTMAFYIDQYGCGSLGDSTGLIGKKIRQYQKVETYEKFWDPTLRMDRIKDTSILFLDLPGDVYFPLKDVADTYQHLTVPFMTSFQPTLVHHHNVWIHPDPYAFAKSVLFWKDENKLDYYNHKSSSFDFWIGQVYPEFGENDFLDPNEAKNEGYFEVVFDSAKPLEFSEMVYTYDKADEPNRSWAKRMCGIVLQEHGCDYTTTSSRCLWRAGGLVPESATSWYVLVHASEGQLMASSRLFTRVSEQRDD